MFKIQSSEVKFEERWVHSPRDTIALSVAPYLSCNHPTRKRGRDRLRLHRSRRRLLRLLQSHPRHLRHRRSRLSIRVIEGYRHRACRGDHRSRPVSEASAKGAGFGSCGAGCGREVSCIRLKKKRNVAMRKVRPNDFLAVPLNNRSVVGGPRWNRTTDHANINKRSPMFGSS